MFPARVRTFARATLLAGVLAASVSAAHAAGVEGSASLDGAVNLANYSGCAGGLAIATTFPQAWAAIAFCCKIVADEWDRTF